MGFSDINLTRNIPVMEQEFREDSDHKMKGEYSGIQILTQSESSI
jgi:hypothetical protein